jgi:hypothetical protein
MSTEQTITTDAYITGIQRINSTAWIRGTRQSISSTSYFKEPESSIICDGSAVDNIVDEFGTDVTVRVVSRAFSDEYGDATETYTDTQVRALVQSYTARDQEVREGQFLAGEMVFTFKKEDEAKIVPTNRVMYAGTWYEIREVIKNHLVQTLYYLEAGVQKI